MGMDTSTDDATEGRWLTYAELAELRQIDKHSALKLALRRKWPRRKDNHGTMQVCVPLEWAVPPERARDMGMDMSRAIAALETAVSTLREQLGQANGRADSERSRAERLEAQLQATLAKLEQAQAQYTGERSKAELAQAAFGQADEARRQAEKARVDQDAARRGRGLLARLLAAWRAE